MKRLISILLAILMLLSATALMQACKKNDGDGVVTTAEQTEENPSDFQPLPGTLYDGGFYTINIPNGFEKFQGTTYLNGANGLTIESTKMAAVIDGQIPDIWKSNLNAASILSRYNTASSKDYQITKLNSLEYVDERIYELSYTLYNTQTKKTLYCSAIAIRSDPNESGSIQYVNIHMTESDETRPFAKSLTPAVK